MPVNYDSICWHYTLVRSNKLYGRKQYQWKNINSSNYFCPIQKMQKTLRVQPKSLQIQSMRSSVGSCKMVPWVALYFVLSDDISKEPKRLENLLENWFHSSIYVIAKILIAYWVQNPLWFHFHLIFEYSKICLQGEIYLSRVI